MSSDRTPNALIGLEAFHVLSFSFDTVEDYESPSSDRESPHKIQIAFTPELHPEDVRRLRVTMLVNLFPEPNDSKNVPYKLSARSAGYFVAPFDMDQDSVSANVIVNALSIMYGALRGIILQTTAAASYGPVLMPTVDMADVVQHWERVSKQPEPDAEAPKPATERKAKRKRKS